MLEMQKTNKQKRFKLYEPYKLLWYNFTFTKDLLQTFDIIQRLKSYEMTKVVGTILGTTKRGWPLSLLSRKCSFAGNHIPTRQKRLLLNRKTFWGLNTIFKMIWLSVPGYYSNEKIKANRTLKKALRAFTTYNSSLKIIPELMKICTGHRGWHVYEQVGGEVVGVVLLPYSTSCKERNRAVELSGAAARN